MEPPLELLADRALEDKVVLKLYFLNEVKMKNKALIWDRMVKFDAQLVGMCLHIHKKDLKPCP